MYKSRIRTWGLDKKIKENEARAIIHMLARHRGTANHIQLRGRRVDIKAVESHFKRKGILIADVLSTDAPHVSDLICETPNMSKRRVPQCLTSPDAFKITELLCADVREYVLSSFETGFWLAKGHYQYCDTEGIISTAQFVVQDFLEMVAVCWDEVMDQPSMATMENVRKVSAKFMKSIECRISESLPLIMQLIAAVLVWPPIPLGRILSKQLCFIVANHDFGESHVKKYFQRIFSRIGRLASSDEIPSYLLAATRSSVDSYERVLGQYHPQTLSVTVILSQMMCILYGPNGLSEPLEALLSSLESQQGPGTRQSLMLRSEMRRLGEVRDDRAQG